MNKTKIEWCDWSWNPVTGCRHGCLYCYARAISRRFGRSFEPEFHPERLGQPSRVRPGGSVFVCSMADLFGEWVPRPWIEAVINQTRLFDFTWIYLTKNPGRYLEFDFPPSSILGATAVDQAGWDRAAEALSRVKHLRTMISAEPLLGRILPGWWLPDWIIIGPRTGPGGCQPKSLWTDTLISSADKAGIPVFTKPALAGYSRKDFAPRKNLTEA